jgi:Zn finger protein HypA/HybF involved in hydrogenase expression
MSKIKIYFEVKDNAVFKYTPVPEMGENNYKTEVVMTKEIFQECYKKWINPRIGHWISVDGTKFECSECNAQREMPVYKENYCSKCGAKMIELQESEE